MIGNKSLAILTLYSLSSASPHSMLMRHLIDSVSKEVQEVIVYTSKASYREVEYKYILPENVRIKNIPVLGRQSNRISVRVIVWLQFFIFSLMSLLFSKKIDVLHVSTTPPLLSGLLGRIVKKVKSTKVIYHLQDIYPEMLYYSGALKRNKLFRTLKNIDTKSMSYADSCVVLSGDMKKSLLERGIDEDKVSIINNCSLQNPSKQIDQLRVPDKIKIVYAGNIGRMQYLEELVDTFLGVDSFEFEFHIIGEGVIKSKLKEKVIAREETFKIRDYLPYDELSDFIKTCDFGIVSLSTGVLSVAYPSKTWTYLSLGCPLVLVADEDSEMFTEVSDLSLGVAVDPQRIRELPKRLYKYVADREALDTLRNNTYVHYLKTGTVAVYQEKWMQLYRSIFSL